MPGEVKPIHGRKKDTEFHGVWLSGAMPWEWKEESGRAAVLQKGINTREPEWSGVHCESGYDDGVRSQRWGGRSTAGELTGSQDVQGGFKEAWTVWSISQQDRSSRILSVSFLVSFVIYKTGSWRKIQPILSVFRLNNQAPKQPRACTASACASIRKLAQKQVMEGSWSCEC